MIWDSNAMVWDSNAMLWDCNALVWNSNAMFCNGKCLIWLSVITMTIFELSFCNHNSHFNLLKLANMVLEKKLKEVFGSDELHVKQKNVLTE